MSTVLATLADAVAAAGAQTELSLSASERYQGGDHTVEVSGTFVGTVEFEGRIDTNWFSLGSFTAAGLQNIAGTYDAIRANVTAYTSGSITMKARYPVLQDLKTDLSTLLTRLSAARATLMDNLARLDVAISTVSSSANIKNLIKLLREHGKL